MNLRSARGNPVIDHFKLVAPWYERIIPPHGDARLLELLDLPASGPVVDVGGGTGRVAQLLRAEGQPVVVLDENWSMLQQARQKDELGVLRGQSEKLPLASRSVERILMVDALHHVASQEHTARELWRVLKPGGTIVIEEPDLRRLVVRLLALAEKAALMRSRFLEPEAIAGLFPEAGSQKQVVTEGVMAYVVVKKHA
jgi:ubiquinone/menaquinone biosynthesis C-methylase UbiE